MGSCSRFRSDPVRTEESPADLIAWDTASGKQLWQRTIGGRMSWMRWRGYANPELNPHPTRRQR